MLKCQGGCQRMVNEYYIMPDGKIFCYDCWRYGKERSTNQQRDNWERYQAERVKYDNSKKQLERQIEELTDRINREKSRCRSDWYSYEDGNSNKPFNYADVEYLEKQRTKLYWQKNSDDNRPRMPYIGAANNYYTSARFISADKSHFYETVTIPSECAMRAKKAAEEAHRCEEERKRQEEEIKEQKRLAEELKKKEILSAENSILNNTTIPLANRIELVGQTRNNKVLIKLSKDKSPQVRRAVAKLVPLDDEIIESLFADTDISVIRILCGRSDISYEKLRKFANHSSSGIRTAIATNPITPVDILSKLALDESINVRNAILKNGNTPDNAKENARKLNKDKRTASSNSGCLLYLIIILASSVFFWNL